MDGWQRQALFFAFWRLVDAYCSACLCIFGFRTLAKAEGKTQVHNMANKKIKCNLHMALLTAVKLDPELKTYYERKVAKGKNKMCALNNVKNKLLARVVACVNNQREYVKKAALRGKNKVFFIIEIRGGGVCYVE
ncbi:MAG: hypothetical protein EAY75_06945 [Bacteroidetes bacterium]|nr:MAG: hypothetical protein EAY75_06945 [Bacteroidota bacterium]